MFFFLWWCPLWDGGRLKEDNEVSLSEDQVYDAWRCLPTWAVHGVRASANRHGPFAAGIPHPRRRAWGARVVNPDDDAWRAA